jgi:Secreted repeat of unknown function
VQANRLIASQLNAVNHQLHEVAAWMGPDDWLRRSVPGTSLPAFTFWLLVPSGTPAAGSTVSGKFSVLTDANGRQVLYNGHPLYAFVKDKASSDANGEGVNAFGGTWHPATPDLPAI